MYSILFFIVLFRNILCEVDNNEKEENLYKNVLDLTNMKIDKDTIINRNFKLEKKSRGKNEPEPDWSYASFSEEVASHVTAFKRNMTECLKHVQKNDKRTTQTLSPRKESPINGECLIACVLKRNGVLEQGKVNKANLINLLRKFYGNKPFDLRTLERCATQAELQRDDCRAAAALSNCAGDLF